MLTVSDEMVRKRIRMFDESRTNGHNEAWSGRHFKLNNDLVRKVDEKIHENKRATK